MSMFKKELKELQLKQELVGFTRDCSDDILYGLIARVGSDYIAMNNYYGDGGYAGFTIFLLDQITGVKWGTRDCKARSHIIRKNGIDEVPEFSCDAFEDIIIELGQKSESTEFYYEDDDEDFQLGKVVEHDNKWIKIKTFGTRHTLTQGFELIPLKDILRIVVNSPYQKEIIELHNTDL